jgi:DNA-binding PadR family transcriptional regulator
LSHIEHSQEGRQHGRTHGRQRRGGGLGRFFAHGDLRLVILQLIAEKPRHGYELIKAIEEQVAGAYTPSPGVIYPTLTLLEELGYVTVSTGESAKKLHEITAEGRAFLDANRRTVDALFARMVETSRAHVGGTAPQILRAMENLKLALQLRLARPAK